MIKFLPGILILQAVTAGLSYLIIIGGAPSENHLFFTLIALDIAFILLMTLWFSSIARQHNFVAMESLKETHAKEREKLRVNAERQKNRLVNKKHKEILKETKRAYAMANIKVSTVLAGLIILGGGLLYSQFIAFGSILLTAGGGVLLGYLARTKQEAFFRPRKPALPKLSPEAIEKQEPEKIT